jgi:hypothetical protein
MKNPSQDSLRLGGYLNLVFPEYKSEKLPLVLTCSLDCVEHSINAPYIPWYGASAIG